MSRNEIKNEKSF